MTASPARLMARVIPDRLNRALWWLTVGVAYPIVLVGPVAASAIYGFTYGTPFLDVALWLWGLNLTILTIAMAVGALVLRHLSRPLDARRALAFALVISISGAVVRAIVIRLTYPLGLTPMTEVGTPYFLVQLGLGIVLVTSVASAIIYASHRESALDAAFLELKRAQVSLAQEEEHVRAEVFDQLHGSLQARFVALRQELSHLAESTSDPEAARIASRVERSLESTYRDDVQTLTRTLIPSGLEAGLGIALAELDTRLSGAIDVNLRIDPVVQAMDNPMTGGMHWDVRLAAYRIVEEATANALEHSHARQVTIDVQTHLEDGAAILDLDVAHAREAPIVVVEGSGVTRMRGRAQALGGRVDLVCEPDRFVVRASLPLARPVGGS